MRSSPASRSLRSTPSAWASWARATASPCSAFTRASGPGPRRCERGPGPTPGANRPPPGRSPGELRLLRGERVRATCTSTRRRAPRNRPGAPRGPPPARSRPPRPARRARSPAPPGRCRRSCRSPRAAVRVAWPDQVPVLRVVVPGASLTCPCQPAETPSCGRSAARWHPRGRRRPPRRPGRRAPRGGRCGPARRPRRGELRGRGGGVAPASAARRSAIIRTSGRGWDRDARRAGPGSCRTPRPPAR